MLYHYWTFDLSPFVFEIKNIPFQWVSTLWGIISLALLFLGVFLISKIPRFSKPHQELIRSVLFYGFGIFAILYGLNRFHINWGLRWYSTMYLIGFLSVYFGCLYWSKKQKLMLTENMIVNLIAFCILGMLLGARLTYVFVYNWDYYKMHPLEIIATWQGGLAFHGGIIGVCLVLVLFCKKYQIPFFHLTDKLARLVPIGIGFGRIGNFMNGELWGRPIESHIPWAIIFPEGGNMPRHPSQIYQSLVEGWLLFFTLWFISRWKQREGTISACFLIFYCIYRFFMEYFRAADVQLSYLYLNHLTWAPLNAYPDTKWWEIVTMGQLLCFIFFISGLFFLKITRKNILEESSEWIARNTEFFRKHKDLNK
jgi:phosphatidylglycerol:prolipoprotein diacylglycerol transferase